MLQTAQLGQEWAWSLGQQAVRPLLGPSYGVGAVLAVLAPQRLRHFGNMLGGMGKIEDTHRFGAVIVGQLLQPVGAVHDGRHFPGIFQPAVVGFYQG